jgi:hypothetical protein
MPDTAPFFPGYPVIESAAPNVVEAYKTQSTARLLHMMSRYSKHVPLFRELSRRANLGDMAALEVVVHVAAVYLSPIGHKGGPREPFGTLPGDREDNS